MSHAYGAAGRAADTFGCGEHGEVPHGLHDSAHLPRVGFLAVLRRVEEARVAGVAREGVGGSFRLPRVALGGAS